MAPNDANTYKVTEQHKRALKQHELRARNICVNIQHEKGPDLKIIEFFDDQIKKYEFQLGITPGILEQSLVRENQLQQEEREFEHKKPNLDENIDCLDLGAAQAQPQPEFIPPKINNIVGGVNMTLDQNQNQTIRLGGGVDESRAFQRPGQLNGTKFNDTVNDTIGGIVVAMNKEENERSETGGDDYMNFNDLKDKPKNTGAAAGGTGSSTSGSQRMYQN